MKVSFRLSDADRERFGGDEWIHIDTDVFADLGYDRLSPLEREIRRTDDTSIARILAVEWPDTSMLGMRGIVWLARQFSGLKEPAWPDFKPDVLGILQKLGPRDADPPVGGSSESPSDKTEQAKTGRSKKDSTS